MNRDRFQGKCLINEEGYRFMSCFDSMPPKARERLRNSRFNICAACVKDEARSVSSEYSTDNYDQEKIYLQAIRNIEAQLG